EIESEGRLCEVGEFVEIECGDTKVGDFVHKPAILRTQSEVVRDIEIRAAAVHKGSTRLPLGTGHAELVGRIEDQCSTAAKHVRPDAARADRNMRDQCAGDFVKISLQR